MIHTHRLGGRIASAVMLMCGVVACADDQVPSVSSETSGTSSTVGQTVVTKGSGTTGAGATQTSATPAVSGRPVNRLETIAPLKRIPRWRVGTVAVPIVNLGEVGEEGDLATLQDSALASAPPDNDQAVFRAVDPAGWTRLAVELGRLRALNPLRQTRMLAMVTTAMAVAVLDNQSVAPEPSPLDADPTMDRSKDAPISPPAETHTQFGPADSVAAAGAAFAVLDGLFPSDGHRLQAARTQTVEVAWLSGLWTPHDVASAWSVGTSAGAQTLSASSEDGSQTKKPFVQPEGGTWETSAPVFGAAVEPGGAEWTLWNECTTKTVAIPAPPLPGSSDFARATRQVVDISKDLTDGQRRLAEQWGLGPGSETPPGQWINIMGDLLGDANIAVEDQVVALAALATMSADTGVVLWQQKYKYSLIRPIDAIRATIDPNWSPILVTPAFPAYPSGHSAFSAVAAAVMSQLFPERKAEFLESAAAAGDSRVVGGIHYWFDNHFGAQLGWDIARSCSAVGLAKPPGDATELFAALKFDEP